MLAAEVAAAHERAAAAAPRPQSNEAFLCPIGHMVMANPVVADDGHTYEQEHIERWLAINSIAEPLFSCSCPRILGADGVRGWVGQGARR